MTIHAAPSGESEGIWAQVSQPLIAGVQNQVPVSYQQTAPGVLEISGLPPGRLNVRLGTSKDGNMAYRSQNVQLAGDVVFEGDEIRGVVVIPVLVLNLKVREKTIGFVLCLGSGNARLESANNGKCVAPGVPEVHDGRNKQIDLLAGSGLRSGGDHPNGHALPSYEQVNLGIAQRIEAPTFGRLEARFDIINVLDEVYRIRDGTGIGVGAPQFGPRRAFFAGLKKEF